jgi:hypothetical protein
MKPVVLIREENITLPLDDFYRAVETVVDQANPRTHMSHDFSRDPLRFGLTLYPPRVYEKIRELKEQQQCQKSK